MSSSPGEFHPRALTEPYVNLLIHTALPMLTVFRLLHFRNLPPPLSGWAINFNVIGQTLRSIPITETSSLLRSGPPLWDTLVLSILQVLPA